MRATEFTTEDWQKVNRNDKTDGMSKKAVSAYRRENPGSKLKTAVTTKPSKLKKGSKASNRRKSFCARMSGMKKSRTSAKTKRDPDSNINKALRRWNCESIEEMRQLIEYAEHQIAQEKTDPSVCRSPKRLGRSDHSSCVSQGLRPHQSKGKGHTDGNGHYLKGKKAKSVRYGGNVKDYSGK